MFQVVSVSDGLIPVRDENGLPILFGSGKEAMAFATAESERTGKKFQPRRIASGDWRKREQARFDCGEYVNVPWRNAPWFAASEAAKNHFVHVSNTDPTKVAYTANEADGNADKQTRTKPGKYLEKYFGDVLSNDDIQAISLEYSNLYEENKLLFANDADDIEWVYTNGPNSCMSHAASKYESPFHPARVYAAGDLAVAYMKRQNRVTARALCWPEKKIYGRVYGDADRLAHLLKKEGFVQIGFFPFEGAKLVRHEYKGGLVVPYIDWSTGIRDDGDFLIIDKDGPISTERTEGISTVAICEYCGDNIYNDNGHTVLAPMEETWCQSCSDSHSVWCEDIEALVHDELAVPMLDGEFFWMDTYFSRYGFTSDLSGINYPNSTLTYVYDEYGTTYSWSRLEAKKNASYCKVSERYLIGDNLTKLPDGRLVFPGDVELKELANA